MVLTRRFANRIVLIGCGSIGQGLLPVLFSAFSIEPAQLTIVTADERGRDVAEHFGVRFLVAPLSPENYRSVLDLHLRSGDLLLNLSVNVASLALIEWCKARDVLYLDTCVEPWSGGYVADGSPAPQTTNAWLRRQALALHTPGAATAVIAHGMNPGLISHLLKEALLALARNKNVAVNIGPDWSRLAQTLGVKVVHISERDTQDDTLALASGVFANTWSAEGLYSESWLQRAEIGWGTHERDVPAGSSMQGKSLCLAQRGADIRMRTWLPSQGELHGMPVTHHEVISITELLACDGYSPTVCYIYCPCPKAGQSMANLRAGTDVSSFRVLASDSVQGFDEIGVLLVHETGALWHGFTLTSEEARLQAPYNNATSLQVVAGIIGALTWMLDHPREGVVEAENMDSEQVLATARPYLGKMTTIETDWCAGRSLALEEFLLGAETRP